MWVSGEYIEGDERVRLKGIPAGGRKRRKNSVRGVAFEERKTQSYFRRSDGEKMREARVGRQALQT